MICNICKKDKINLVEHHITSKCYGGTNDAYNKVELCTSCHKAVHYGIYIIEGWFGSTTGRILVWRKFFKESISGMKDPDVWLQNNYKYIREQYLIKKEKNNG